LINNQSSVFEKWGCSLENIRKIKCADTLFVVASIDTREIKLYREFWKKGLFFLKESVYN